MIVEKVEKDSRFAGIIKPGDKLMAINGRPVLDNLDCMYRSSDEKVTLTFVTAAGQKKYTCNWHENLGLTFEPDKIKVCKNKCIFCFVHQQPKGMRRSLYLRDDDYRLSFTHGNFITFSNLGDSDLKRIVRQGLSPLYVSIHSTDDDLRRKMFGNRSLPDIMPQLKYLVKNDIMLHTQIVVCPGYNDDKHLAKTINDLYALYPGVQTLGVVPVGLTRYRDKLPRLESFDKAGAIEVIDYVEQCQREFKKVGGSRFVFSADEFYILAERPFPSISEYEAMEQFENGIGMVRLLLTDFNRRKRYLNKNNRKKKILILTGESAGTIFDLTIIPELTDRNFKISVLPVKNKFWGETVTVSGLLTGKDILDQLNNHSGNYDFALLPPNCLNNDNLFLDDMTLDEFRCHSKIDIKTSYYSIIDTINEALQ
ncbi:MAG: DUF512 domain-containing protein [Candidatus Zixiibacteriota bacterium]